LFFFSDKKFYLSLHFGLLCTCFVLGGFDQGKSSFLCWVCFNLLVQRLSFLFLFFKILEMGVSKKLEVDGGLVRPSLKPISTKARGKESQDDDEGAYSTTPTAKEA
jgi:hypothetical protein